MGKDFKQKAKAKAKQGLISWDDVPDNLKKQIDRHNFDGGEFRKEKLDKEDKASKKLMKKDLKDYYENGDEI